MLRRRYESPIKIAPLSHRLRNTDNEARIQALEDPSKTTEERNTSSVKDSRRETPIKTLNSSHHIDELIFCNIRRKKAEPDKV